MFWTPKKFFLLCLCGTLALGVSTVGYDAWRTQELEGPSAPPQQKLETLLPSSPVEENTETEIALPVALPSSINIEMPFYTQAPFSNWDYPWQEACEEASVLLVANLYNKMNLSKEAYNTELLRLVDWEKEYFGAYEHTTVAQTVEMLSLNYHLEATIHEGANFQEMQSALAEGHLIIAPFAGKLLHNPNFKNGGPNYHMLVIKGYDSTKNQIVTHDVGTRNGADYVYNWSILQNALHDWNDTDITMGEPRWIEVSPPTP